MTFRDTSQLLLLLLFAVHTVLAYDEYHANPRTLVRSLPKMPQNEAEVNPRYWRNDAQAMIEERLRRYENLNTARNVVLFMGDGMSVPTLAAARALLGQRQGQTGEEAQLSFEAFPTVGLSKTYCVDAQVADSACSATAYLCGVKANRGTIGVSAAISRYNCTAAITNEEHVESIAAWALQDGRDAGFVTTTRVTHASPAGTYAHTAQRDWESDADMADSCQEMSQNDIALQLVTSYPGNEFKVIFGGGRREFLPNTTIDEEGSWGRRLDGRNLIEEWEASKAAAGHSYEYIWNRDQLMQSSAELPEYMLGLFEASHMQYHMQANETTEPTLAELTEVAIRSLSRNKNGFFLFVEGGRIDHAHHSNYVQLALDETIEFSEAIARATTLLSEEDSLIVVTSDHAHVMAYNGYTHRGGDILGTTDDLGDDGIPYTTLSYTNGPGFSINSDLGGRDDITKYNYHDTMFAYPAGVPLSSETHGGDDVGIFARGPQQHLFTGLYEQNHIPHLLAYAACMGPGRHACSLAGASAATHAASLSFVLLALTLVLTWFMRKQNS